MTPRRMASPTNAAVHFLFGRPGRSGPEGASGSRRSGRVGGAGIRIPGRAGGIRDGGIRDGGIIPNNQFDLSTCDCLTMLVDV